MLQNLLVLSNACHLFLTAMSKPAQLELLGENGSKMRPTLLNLGTLPWYYACPGTQRMTSPLQCNSARVPSHVAFLKILQLWLNVDQKCEWDGYRDVPEG